MTDKDKSFFDLYREKSQAKSDEEKQKIQMEIDQMWENEVEECAQLVLSKDSWSAIRDSLKYGQIKAELIWSAIYERGYSDNVTTAIMPDIIERLKDYF